VVHRQIRFLALHARTTGNAANPADVYVSRIATHAPGAAYRADEAKALRDDASLRRRALQLLRQSIARRLPR